MNLWPFKKSTNPDAEKSNNMEAHNRVSYDDRENTVAHIEALALDAEKEAIGKYDDMLSAVVTAHRNDCDSYKFDCNRWGDFLTLCMGRDTHAWDFSENKLVVIQKTYVTSINLREIREMRFIEGSAADANGTLTYSAVAKIDNGSLSWGAGYGFRTLKDGWNYVVYPVYPDTECTKALFSLRDTSQRTNSIMMGDDSYRPKLRTPNYPRNAVDDRIDIQGINATIYTPAGMGRGVYDKMLREISDGSSTTPVEIKTIRTEP